MLEAVMDRQDNERLEIVVTGRVQGVAFRWYAQRTAGGLGVTGWVRNQPDGSVRIVAEGPRAALASLLDWARQGPDHARVEDLRHVWQEATGQFTRFEITG
jgi:acylphosphatase